jgi:hypothetical protein
VSTPPRDDPLDLGVGGFDCGAGQTGSSPVTEILVPAASATDPAYYDVWTTLAFGDAAGRQAPGGN